MYMKVDYRKKEKLTVQQQKSNKKQNDKRALKFSK